MDEKKELINRKVNRRSFLTKGAMAAGAATMGAAITGGGTAAFGEDCDDRLAKGDIAILRFLAAAEILESDLSIQYAELGGIGDITIALAHMSCRSKLPVIRSLRF